MEYKVIDRAHRADIQLKNEPFLLYGRMIPTYDGERWSCREKLFAAQEITQMCFPEENYDYDALAKDHVFVGAYDGETCVGVAILADAWFRYLYLEDLKVCTSYRGKGVGRGLIEKSAEVARERGYHGLYTVGQDNNLTACRFYLKTGFEIGGFDNRVYRGTSQEDKADIIFYRE